MAITKIGTPELFDFSATNTALQLPTGDTASRPTSPSTGEWRFNSELKYVEYYDGADWFQIDTDANTPVGSENFNVNTYFGNGATQVIDAKFNEAANFNGSSSNVTIAGSSFDYAAMTVSCWFNLSTTSQNYQTIFNNYSQTSGQNRGWHIRYETGGNGNLRFYGFSNSNNEFNILQSTTINASTWYHLAVTISSSQIKIYQNNNLINTTSISSSIGYSGTGGFPTIGSYRNTASSYANYFNGKIDQVRIYDSALSQAAVTALQLETTTTASSLSFPTGETAIATYQLDGNGDDISTNYNATSTTDIGYTGLEFQPDLVWIKARQGTISNILIDSVRGVSRQLASNSAETEYFNSGFQTTAFNSNGFTVVDQTNGGYGVNGAPGQSYSGTNAKYVAWNWKAGGTPTALNSKNAGEVPTLGSVMIDGVASTAVLAGSLAATKISANTAAGFSIVSYTGSSTLGDTIGHGLNAAPDLIICKKTTGATNWAVWSSAFSAASQTLFLDLNSPSNQYTDRFGTVNSTTFQAGINGGSEVNPSGGGMIAYAFRSIAGYSKIGSYTWTGTSYTAGTMVTNLGFEPSFVMIKGINLTSNWQMYDNKRVSGTQSYALYADLSDAEVTTGYQGIGFDSDGFSAIVGADGNTTASSSLNQQNETYIYMAIAAT
jgi:hypothetical protein